MHDGIQRVLLARKRRLPSVRDDRSSKPVADRLKVLSLQPVEIGATYGVEPSPIAQDRGEFIAVGDDHPLSDLIGEAHEGGEFVPGEGRAVRPELGLIGVVVAKVRFKHAISTHVALPQCEPVLDRQGDCRERPDCFRLMERLGRQIGFDEHFERVAALLWRRKVHDALFEVSKPCEAVEEFAQEI